MPASLSVILVINFYDAMLWPLAINWYQLNKGTCTCALYSTEVIISMTTRSAWWWNTLNMFCITGSLYRESIDQVVYLYRGLVIQTNGRLKNCYLFKWILRMDNSNYWNGGFLRHTIQPTSWWLQMSWHQIGARPSATTMLTLRWWNNIIVVHAS